MRARRTFVGALVLGLVASCFSGEPARPSPDDSTQDTGVDGGPGGDGGSDTGVDGGPGGDGGPGTGASRAVRIEVTSGAERLSGTRFRVDLEIGPPVRLEAQSSTGGRALSPDPAVRRP